MSVFTPSPLYGNLLLSKFSHTGNCDFPIGGHLVGILVPAAPWKRYQFSVKLSQALKSAFGFCRDRLESGTHASPAAKGQNCSFFDKSIKLGRVTSLYKTNIS